MTFFKAEFGLVTHRCNLLHYKMLHSSNCYNKAIVNVNGSSCAVHAMTNQNVCCEPNSHLLSKNKETGLLGW